MVHHPGLSPLTWSLVTLSPPPILVLQDRRWQGSGQMRSAWWSSQQFSVAHPHPPHPGPALFTLHDHCQWSSPPWRDPPIPPLGQITSHTSYAQPSPRKPHFYENYRKGDWEGFIAEREGRFVETLCSCFLFCGKNKSSNNNGRRQIPKSFIRDYCGTLRWECHSRDYSSTFARKCKTSLGMFLNPPTALPTRSTTGSSCTSWGTIYQVHHWIS